MIDSERIAIGKRLEEARKMLTLKQGELADSLEIKQGSLSDFERGRSLPSPRVLASLSNLGVNLNWLLTGAGEPIEDGKS